MIYLKLFEGFKDIDRICRKYAIKNYIINSDGTIDVDGDVNLSNERLERLPLKFNNVSGDFDCMDNKLTSLEGAPKEVGHDFSCSFNKLTSLEGAPREVGGNFYCSYNQLTTLEFAPIRVGGTFFCSGNKLTSLKGAPKEVSSFDCSGNQLTSLKGAPKRIGGSFNCYDNFLPQLIYDNYKYIKEIVKWQDEYNIWRGGKLDQFRFGEMMIDIKNEVDQ